MSGHKMHPPIEAHASGRLNVGDGHELYWECSGNPNGIPALYLHGGPGGASSAGVRRFFDPNLYRAVLFDQRGCGRSTPRAFVENYDRETQTMEHLLRDIEALRAHLNIEQFTLFGISWGTTLALAYAERFPERVRAAVLALTTTASEREVRWMTEDLGRLYTEAHAEFLKAVPAAFDGQRVVDAYANMLWGDDRELRAQAAQAWCRWDCTQMGVKMNSTFDDPNFCLSFARLVTHYWANHAFLEPDQLICDAGILNRIPGIMIHGTTDISCPIDIPWRLAQVWTSSKIVTFDGGHGTGEGFESLVVKALIEIAAL